MEFLQKIYAEIETEQDIKLRSKNKAALYTFVNYLEAKQTGVTKTELKRFMRQKQFAIVWQKLVDSAVVEENSDATNYKLTTNARSFLSPLLNNIMSLSNTEQPRSKSTNSNSNILEICRSEIFAS